MGRLTAELHFPFFTSHKISNKIFEAKMLSFVLKKLALVPKNRHLEKKTYHFKNNEERNSNEMLLNHIRDGICLHCLPNGFINAKNLLTNHYFFFK